MSVTKPLVDFALYDPAIKIDSTPSASDIQDFAKVEDLEIASDAQLYASFEPDFWLLNGNYKLLPVNDTNVHVGWMSTEQSEADTDFAVAPVLTINFSVVHDTDGLTLIFSEIINEWADDITVAFYDSSFALIRTDNYTPTAYEFYTNQAVSAFKRIIITFNSWNKTFRYLRLQSIDYGKLLHFANEQIQDCRVVEEINPLSLTLPIGTMELTLLSTETGFDITDPAGNYFLLQYRQSLNVYESVDGNKVFIGTYYLDTWNNPSDTQIRFECVDILGILDKVQDLGNMYHLSMANSWNRKADILIDDMADGGGASWSEGGFEYTIDLALNADGFQVYGHVPITNFRQSLKLIALAMGGYIVCARSGKVNFKKTILASDLSTFDYTLTKADIGINALLSLLPLVTGVEITSHDYAVRPNPDYVPVIFFDEDIGTGVTTILFSSPVYSFGTYAGSSITATYNGNANFFSANVSVAGHLNLIASEFVDGQKTVSQYDGSLPVGTPDNIIEIDATLISSHNVDDVLALAYNYYQQRYQIKAKFFAPQFTVGDSVLVDTQNNKQLAGIVERMEIDLANGFVAIATIRGVIYTP